jgi:Ser/Thr protein kinase RdoA (MazF antagonist)
MPVFMNRSMRGFAQQSHAQLPYNPVMQTQPFSELTPDIVLDALESIGFNGDGRLLGLNSYENRVYQVGTEAGSPLVAKFYRPARWTDAEILEEHEFVALLAEREIPVVPALETNGNTLHQFNGFRFFRVPQARRPCAGTG